MKKKFFITGAAGFIGFHLCKRLIENDYQVIGFDNLNSYYDVKLKESRIIELNKISKDKNYNWEFIKGGLEDNFFLKNIINQYKPNIVINLAAQAGVRYSIENPSQYINSNIVGFGNLLEIVKDIKLEHLVYASSSSVYGNNTKIPFSEVDQVDNPLSIYAATKKSNELMAYSYSHLHNIPSTGLRFFTVYGPWGRPDMAPMIFSKSIINSEPIKVFNYGEMMRDFTYIDDVIESLVRIINIPPKSITTKVNDANSKRKICHRIVNIGNGKPTNLLDFINILEEELKIKGKIQYEEMQQGDVKITYADNKLLESLIGHTPKTDLREGIKNFVSWYKNYYL